MSTHVSQSNPASTFFSLHYFKCSEKIFKIKMGSCEKASLIFLFQFQNCGATFPSIPSIASAIEYNIKTVRKALKNLEDTFHFIKTTPLKGNSNTYEILYENIENSYQDALIEEKKTKIYLVPPLPKTVPVPKKTLVSTPTKIGTTTPTKNGRGVLPKTVGVPLPKTVPDNNDLKITIYNDDDDKALCAGIPSPSHQKNTVQQPADEQPVAKKKEILLSAVEACEQFKQIIHENGKPTSFMRNCLFEDVKISSERSSKIIKYALTNNKTIQKYSLVTSEDVLSAILGHGGPNE